MNSWKTYGLFSRIGRLCMIRFVLERSGSLSRGNKVMSPLFSSMPMHLKTYFSLPPLAWRSWRYPIVSDRLPTRLPSGIVKPSFSTKSMNRSFSCKSSIVSGSWINVRHRPFVALNISSAALASSTEEATPETGMKRLAPWAWAIRMRAAS